MDKPKTLDTNMTEPKLYLDGSYQVSWLVMVFNATFNNISVQLYRGCQVYWWKKPEYPEKTNKLYQIILWLSGIRTHNFSGDWH